MEKTSHHQLLQTTATSNNRHATRAQAIAFGDHIKELRSRIFWVALLFLATSALAYQYREILVHLVLSPLGDQKLIYLNPAGGFSFIFQITMYAGAIVTAPFLVFQLYKFVLPALPKAARKHAALVFLSAFGLMVSGVLFGYLVAVPSALQFLTTFAGDYVDASLTADSYLNFILAYVAGLGILFQLPLLLIFWHWIKPLTPKELLNSQRFMLVFVFIAAAIITPTPDIVNQLLIAGPILAIYQVGVVAVLLMIRSSKKKQKRALKMKPAAHVKPLLEDFFSELPSDEELIPRRAASQATKPVVPTQRVAHRVRAPILPPSPKLPSNPVKPHAVSAVKPPVRQVLAPRPTLDTLVQRKIHQRPLPELGSRRVTSIDGFMMSRKLQENT